MLSSVLSAMLVLSANVTELRGSAPVEIRVATFNVEDLRTADLVDGGSERAKDIAELLQQIRPGVVLINEIAYDAPGAPGVPDDAEPGRNAHRLAELCAAAQRDGLEPIRYRVFMAPTNTGEPSGLDLDNNGEAVTSHPTPPDRSPAALAYGADCWGFGTFPGQYGMALLIDERFEIVADGVRTFRLLPWSSMPGAKMPVDPESGEPWYAGEEHQRFRLSSKSHWDVPVRLPNGATVHLLCSHPTPPAFDGDERRNKLRNRDEIRFWADYLSGSAYIVDDDGRRSALAPGASFVILGDLNADPDEGTALGDPMGLLFDAPRVNGGVRPTSSLPIEGLDDDDTARFRLRVDYVLPSVDLEVLDSGVWRERPGGADRFPSDHFPVWVDLRVPAP